MAIKIHHGPNGSFKTSGAIQDDLIQAILEGRYIVTNIRGLTLDRVLTVFPDAPSTLQVVNLSMESSEDLARMRSWFMWVPAGAFLIFDETQILFPKAWRDSDLRQFDFPGGLEAAKEADRPTGWLDAWTRHRHWNWDVVLTTPNIRYIRDEIRLTCEKAYLHANLALLGSTFKKLLRKDYKEAMHDAQENRPTSGETIVQLKRIEPRTFALYESTATGSTRETTAGLSLFSSPKLLIGLACIALAIGYAFNSGGVSILTCGINCHADKAVEKAAPVAVSGSSSAPRAVADKPRADLQVSDLAHPFDGLTFVIRAAVSGFHNERSRDLTIFDLVDEEGLSFRQTGDQLRALGYRVVIRNECYIELSRDAWKGSATCARVDQLARAEAFAQAEADRIKSKESNKPSSEPRSMVTVVKDTSRDGRPLLPVN